MSLGRDQRLTPLGTVLGNELMLPSILSEITSHLWQHSLLYMILEGHVSQKSSSRKVNRASRETIEKGLRNELFSI